MTATAATPWRRLHLPPGRKQVPHQWRPRRRSGVQDPPNENNPHEDARRHPHCRPSRDFQPLALRTYVKLFAVGVGEGALAVHLAPLNLTRVDHRHFLLPQALAQATTKDAMRTGPVEQVSNKRWPNGKRVLNRGTPGGGPTKRSSTNPPNALCQRAPGTLRVCCFL